MKLVSFNYSSGSRCKIQEMHSHDWTRGGQKYVLSLLAVGQERVDKKMSFNQNERKYANFTCRIKATDP